MSRMLSRRLLLSRGAIGGAAALAAGCATQGGAPAMPPAASLPTGTGASVLPPNLFGPKPGQALLSRNENPYGPSPRVMAAVAEATTLGAYYADTSYLSAMLAEANGVTPSHVSLSSGSGEGLAAAALAWGKSGTILAPSLFWDTTVLYAERKGVTVKRVPLAADMSIDLAAMEAAVDDTTSLVHICNPNNPTGHLLDPAALKAFAKRVSKKCTVLVDEAYNELTNDPAGNSLMDLVRAGDDVIVARTFSKIYGMAGMRIGYMLTSPENAQKLNSYVMSWMGAPQVAAAVAAYDDQDFLAFSKARVTEARQMVFEAIKTTGLDCIRSETNFVYVKVPDANKLQKDMAERGVMVRGAYGALNQWSRVSMGKLPDVERYCALLKTLYAV